VGIPWVRVPLFDVVATFYRSRARFRRKEREMSESLTFALYKVFRKGEQTMKDFVAEVKALTAKDRKDFVEMLRAEGHDVVDTQAAEA